MLVKNKKLGIVVSEMKIYKATHMKKDNSMIEDFSREVMETYVRRKCHNQYRCRLSGWQSSVDVALIEELREEGEERERKERQWRERLQSCLITSLMWTCGLTPPVAPKIGCLIGFGLRLHISTILNSS